MLFVLQGGLDHQQTSPQPIDRLLTICKILANLSPLFISHLFLQLLFARSLFLILLLTKPYLYRDLFLIFGLLPWFTSQASFIKWFQGFTLYLSKLVLISPAFLFRFLTANECLAYPFLVQSYLSQFLSLIGFGSFASPKPQVFLTSFYSWFQDLSILWPIWSSCLVSKAQHRDFLPSSSILDYVSYQSSAALIPMRII